MQFPGSRSPDRAEITIGARCENVFSPVRSGFLGVPAPPQIFEALPGTHGCLVAR